MDKPALAVTVHDPEERLLRWFDPGLLNLSAIYTRKVAACSGATSPKTVSALRDAGFEIQISDTAGIGESRRIAVREVLSDPLVARIQYADLDRLLHWEYTFPDELRETLASRSSSDYIALGRTERAMETHPQVQIMAETLTNQAFSTLVGLNECADMVAGSCLISRRGAEILVRSSTEPTNGTDLEWPALILRQIGIMPEFRALEGLEFETADCYQDEIEKAGSRAAWVTATYDRPEVWTARTKLALDSIAALGRVLSLPQLGTPMLR